MRKYRKRKNIKNDSRLALDVINVDQRRAAGLITNYFYEYLTDVTFFVFNSFLFNVFDDSSRAAY